MVKLNDRLLLLAALVVTAQTASVPFNFRRDEVCGGSSKDGLAQCRGLDKGLCCSADTNCVYLAGGSTVLCCPFDSCNRMQPISCNTNAQNPELFPKAALKTTVQNIELPRCGEKCCPFGYSCNANGQCDMNEDQSHRPSKAVESALPVDTSIPSSAIPTPTIISTGSSSSTVLPTSSPTTTAQEQQDDGGEGPVKNSFPTAGVVAGVIGGVLALAALGVWFLMFCSRRKREAASHRPEVYEKKHHSRGLCRPSTSSSSFGNFISEPISHDDSALRTDFIRKTSEHGGIHGGTKGIGSLVRCDSISTGGTTFVGVPGDGTSPEQPRLGSAFKYTSPPRWPARTLSNATMTTTHRNAHSIPPIRTMRNQQKPSINKGNPERIPRIAITDSTTPTEPTAPVTPRLQREPSSESINVFADPSTVGSSHGERRGFLGLEPPKFKRLTSATTFTDLMEEAELGDVRRGKPFVPTTPRR